MTATIVITALTLCLIAASILFFPNIKVGKGKIGVYWLVALAGAVVLLCAGLAPYKQVFARFVADDEINPLKILALFFSMTFLSVYLDETGFFRYLAGKAAAHAKSHQIRLFFLLYFLTAVLTVFTSNDVVILTLTPFICFFCKHTKSNPIPYLVGEFVAANTFSMTLVIGNPTNIYLAAGAGIGFGEYCKVMALPTLVGGLVAAGIVLMLFFRTLKKEMTPVVETYEIKDKAELAIGLVHLVGCLVCLVISGYVHIPMWLVSTVAAGSLLVCAAITAAVKKSGLFLRESFVRLPWQLIPFVLSMFVIVVALETQGITQKLGDILGQKACVWTYGAASYVAANLINNIPMSMLFSALAAPLQGSVRLQAVYASIVGSNLGAFLTPIGALAGIMFTGLTEKYGVKYGFRQFVLYGAAVSIPTLAATLGTLTLFV